MNRCFYCPSVTLGGKRIIQRQSPADSACHWCKFMTSRFEMPPRPDIYSGQSDRQMIRFQGVPAHSAIHSSLHIDLNWALLDSLYPSFFLFCLFLKSIEVIFPPWPLEMTGGPRTHMLIHFICCKLTIIGCSHSLILRSGPLTHFCCLAPAQNAYFSACVAPPQQ